MSSHHDQHADRDDLTGEHAWGDTGQAIIAVLFALVWIADSFSLHWTTFLNGAISSWVRVPLGLVCLIAAAYLARKTMSIVFGEVRAVPHVIRKGPYAYTRHPMYSSELLLYLGLLLLSLSLAAAVVFLIAIGFLYYLCRHEEKLLLGRFGDEYAQYMEQVGMWLPRLCR